MNEMMRKNGRLAGALSGFALTTALSAVVAAPAGAETRSAIDVTVGLRAENNPYLLAPVNGASTSAVAGSIEIAPNLQFGDAVTTWRIDGNGRIDQYFSKYGTDVSGTGAASVNHRFSEATSLVLGGFFNTSRGGIRDVFRADPTGTGNPGASSVTDVTITGLRVRQYSYGGNGRLSSRVSARGSLELGGAVRVFQVDSGIGQNSNQYSADLGYSHVVNDRVLWGVRGAFTGFDYRNTRVGDGHVITPSVFTTVKLNATVSFTASGGATFSSIRQLNGVMVRNTGVAATLQLCKDFPTSRFCGSASRDVQATALGGVSTVTTVGLSHNWRLSPRDDLALSANYGRTDQPQIAAAPFAANRTQLIGASAVYSRRLSERLFLTVSPRFDKAWGQGFNRNANYAVLVGLRTRLGVAQ